mmetsp:Transcript_77167/g.221777  ORF Transcript_77167/g.221777 Transcript_77167/m.221777 type:complete len:373 (-) Transcript_77167:780-1898(-)
MPHLPRGFILLVDPHLERASSEEVDLLGDDRVLQDLSRIVQELRLEPRDDLRKHDHVELSEETDLLNQRAVRLEHDLDALRVGEFGEDPHVAKHGHHFEVVLEVLSDVPLHRRRQLALAHVLADLVHLLPREGRVRIERLDDIGDLDDDETESGGADNLGCDRDYPLRDGRWVHVAVAHSHHRRDRPVDGRQVAGLEAVVAARLPSRVDGRVVVVIKVYIGIVAPLQLARAVVVGVPKAREQMGHEKNGHHQNDHLLHRWVDSLHPPHVAELALKPRQPHQLEQAHRPKDWLQDSHRGVRLRGKLLIKYIERHRRQKVHPKPTLQVGLSDLRVSPLEPPHAVLVLVVEGGGKRDADVDEKDEVHHPFDDFVL